MNPLAPVITVLASLLLVALARYLDSQLLFQIYLAVTSVFLVLLVLVQKGRGGGLAGALGGPGGSSAFGAKAGDIFTRITILAAVVWVIFAIGACLWAKQIGNVFGTGGGKSSKPPASSSTNPTDENIPAPGETPLPPTPPSELPSGPELPEATGDQNPADTTPANTTPADLGTPAPPIETTPTEEPAGPPADPQP